MVQKKNTLWDIKFKDAKKALASLINTHFADDLDALNEELDFEELHKEYPDLLFNYGSLADEDNEHLYLQLEAAAPSSNLFEMLTVWKYLLQLEEADKKKKEYFKKRYEAKKKEKKEMEEAKKKTE